MTHLVNALDEIIDRLKGDIQMTSTKKFKLTNAQTRAVQAVINRQLDNEQSLDHEFDTGMAVRGDTISTTVWAALYNKGVTEAAPKPADSERSWGYYTIYPEDHEHHNPGWGRSRKSQYNQQFRNLKMRFTLEFKTLVAAEMRIDTVHKRALRANAAEQKQAFIDEFVFAFKGALSEKTHVDVDRINNVDLRLYGDDVDEWKGDSITRVSVYFANASVDAGFDKHFRVNVTSMHRLNDVTEVHNFTNDLLNAQLTADYLNERIERYDAKVAAEAAAAVDDLEAEEIAAADLRNGE
jgi:hypothetical protein